MAEAFAHKDNAPVSNPAEDVAIVEVSKVVPVKRWLTHTFRHEECVEIISGTIPGTFIVRVKDPPAEFDKETLHTHTIEVKTVIGIERIAVVKCQDTYYSVSNVFDSPSTELKFYSVEQLISYFSENHLDMVLFTAILSHPAFDSNGELNVHKIATDCSPYKGKVKLKQ